MTLERKKVFEQMTEADVRSGDMELANPGPSQADFPQHAGEPSLGASPEFIIYTFLQNTNPT